MKLICILGTSLAISFVSISVCAEKSELSDGSQFFLSWTTGSKIIELFVF